MRKIEAIVLNKIKCFFCSLQFRSPDMILLIATASFSEKINEKQEFIAHQNGIILCRITMRKRSFCTVNYMISCGFCQPISADNKNIQKMR